MKTERQVAGIVLALVMATGTVVGHEGHEHKILGTVTMAAADHVMLKTKEGKEVTVKVNADTKVTKSKESLKVEDLKAGSRIVVVAVGKEEPYTAKTIQVGEAPESSKKDPG